MELLLLGSLLGAGFFGAIAWALRGGREPPSGVPEDRAEAVRRVLKHLQRKTIAELEEGTAGVIVGTVHAIDGVAPLQSPATNTVCLGYHLDIRRAQLDPQQMRFLQLHDDARCVAIEVRDDTGAIRVDPAGLELAITDGPITLWHPPLPPQLLSRVPPGDHTLPITIEEGVLQAGSRILVCGVVTSDVTATDYRDGKPMRVLRASPTFPLVASTDPDLLTPGQRPIAPEELRKR